MPRAVGAAVGLRALRPDPGIVRAVGQVLMGSESHFGDGLIPGKIEVKFLALSQIFCKSLGKGICGSITL